MAVTTAATWQGMRKSEMNHVDPALWLIWIVALTIVVFFPGVFKTD